MLQVFPGEASAFKSADFYKSPIDAEQDYLLDRQFVDLLIEQVPDERSETFPSLQEAIATTIRNLLTSIPA